MTSEVLFPEELENVAVRNSRSFTEALMLVESTDVLLEGIAFCGSFPVPRQDDSALKKISQAFASKSTVKLFRFLRFKIKSTLVAETFRDLIATNSVSKLEFENSMIEEQHSRIMCQAFQERTTPLELFFYNCFPEFVNQVVEASVLNCFSLTLGKISSKDLEMPLKKIFTRGSLCYLRVMKVSGLKDSAFLELSKCILMMPGLTVLDFFDTLVPVSGVKHLFGTMNAILNSGRPRLFEELHLGLTHLNEQLMYCYFKLLESDSIFSLKIAGDCKAPRIVKHISSIVCTTNNLRSFSLNNFFSSGTKFKAFNLQTKSARFYRPFGINL